jgi:MinD-like ATPase involved in chromosome partitioning or flagellar assembly
VRIGGAAPQFPGRSRRLASPITQPQQAPADLRPGGRGRCELAGHGDQLCGADMPLNTASVPAGATEPAENRPAQVVRPTPPPPAQFSPPPASDAGVTRPVPHEFGPATLAEQVWRSAAAMPRGSVLAVSSADGGVGRSTVVAVLGGLLALAVPGPVIALDANPRPWGGLGERVGAGSGSVWDAVRELPRLHSHTEVERWTRKGPSGLLGLAGEVEATAHRHPPAHHQLMSVAAALRRLYPLVLLDLLTAEARGVWDALAGASAALLVARATPDSIAHTLRLLAFQRNAATPQGPAAPLLVVVATSPRVPGEVRAALRQAGTVAAAVHTIPYDPMLARATPVDARLLARSTRRALLGVAADVLQRCVPAAGTAAAAALS